MNARRRFVMSCAALAAAPYASGPSAQTVKTVRIIVPFPAGGGTDVLARLVAEKLRGSYADAAIVENRVGASGRIGIEVVKNAEPDGSTLLFTPDFPLTVYPHSFRKLAYDPLVDFAPVAIVARSNLALAAGPALPANIRTVAEFIAWAKSNPKNALYATTSPGGTPHFVGVMLARDAGLDIAPVHYKGGAQALQDLLGGQIALSVNPVGELLPHVKSGKIRVLATTGPARSHFLPDTPTMVESGYPQIIVAPWLGFLAPARSPVETVARLSAAIGAAVKLPEVAQSFEKFGNEPAPSNPATLAATIRADLAAWGPIVKASGFTAED